MSRIQIVTTPEMDSLLKTLGKPRGLTKAQTLRRAILLLKYLDDQVALGKQILIEDPQTGTATELLLSSHK